MNDGTFNVSENVPFCMQLNPMSIQCSYSTFYWVQDPNRQRNLDETIESSTDVTSIEQNTVANVNATITNIEANNKSSAEQTHKKNKRTARRERFLLDTLLSRKKLYKVLIDKMDK